MKFVTVAVLATAAVATAEKCPLAEMLAYAKSPVVQSCEKASGASLTGVAASGKFPDDSVMKIVCANSDCATAIGGLAKFVPCELLSGAPLGGLLDTFKTKCGAIGGGAAGPTPTTAAPGATTVAPAPGATPVTPGATTPAPAATTPAPATTTRAPAATTAPTEAPSNSTSESSAGSLSSDTGSDNNDGAPKQSQTIPAKTVPAPKKSSSSVVATASGVVFAAVVAALF